MEETRRGLPRTVLFAALSAGLGGLAIALLGIGCLIISRLGMLGDISLIVVITAACAAVACALLAVSESVAVRVPIALRPPALAAVGCGLALAMTVATSIAYGLITRSGPGEAIGLLFELLREAWQDPEEALALTVSALLPFGAVGTARTVARPLAEGKPARWPYLAALATLPLWGGLAYVVMTAGLGSPNSREVWLIMPFCLAAPVVAALTLSASTRLERLIIRRAERHAGS